jgi:hypothetical protein
MIYDQSRCRDFGALPFQTGFRKGGSDRPHRFRAIMFLLGFKQA